MKSVAIVLVLVAMLATPALAAYSETFSYPDGNLAGNGGWIWWDSDPGVNSVEVLNSACAVYADQTSAVNVSNPDIDEVPFAGTDKVDLTMDVRMSDSTGGAGWFNVWDRAGSRVLGGLYWNGTAFYGRNQDTGALLSGMPSPGTTGFTVKMVFDFVAKTVTYSIGATTYGSLAFNPAYNAADAGIGEVGFQAQTNVKGPNSYHIFDNLSITPEPAPPCLSAVTPPASDFITDSFLSVAEASGTGFPPSFTFTIENQSEATAINYTASEVKADGSPTDYPWLSLAPTSGGPIAPAGTAAIVASLTPGALPGIYSGNIKIADDCNPENSHVRPVVLVVGDAPCFVDPFQYVGGSLSGNGGWDGAPSNVLAAADPDNADNQVAKINLTPSTSVEATMSGLGCLPCEDGTLIVLAKVKGSPTGAVVSRDWSINFNDGAGNALAKFEGDYSRVRGRNMADGLLTDYGAISSTQFHELKAVIDIKNNLTTYYLDGGLMTGANPQTHGGDLYNPGPINVGDRIESINLNVESHPDAAGYVLIDDVQVVSCPGVCLGRVSPDRSQNGFTDLPYAAAGATYPTLADGVTQYGASYTFINDGPQSMSYTVEEVAADGVTAFDYPWLTLSKLAGGPVLGGTPDDPVDISYNTTGLAKGLHRGFIKFTDTCTSARSYIRAIQLNVGDCISEDFAYPDGNLESMPGWRTGNLNHQDTVPQQPGGTTPFPVEVVGGLVRVHGAPAPGTVEATHQSIDNCPLCPTSPPYGLISVTAKVKGTIDGGGSRFWYLQFTPLNGDNPLVNWRGGATFVEAETSSGWVAGSLNDGAVHELKAILNLNGVDVQGVPYQAVQYFFDGALLGTAYDIGTIDSRIRFIRIRRDGNATADANPVVEIDDVSISRCESLCHKPFADVDGDGDVDQADFAVLQQCFSGPGGPIPADPTYCACLDKGSDAPAGDGDIDSYDVAAFESCASGPNVPADPNCGG
jgi:hypothetical protein